MLKILQARLQKYVNQELDDVKLYLENAEEPEIKLPTSIGSYKKQRSSRKKKQKTNKQRKISTSTSLTTPNWYTTNLENSSKVGNTRPPYLAPEKSVYRSRNNS